MISLHNYKSTPEDFERLGYDIFQAIIEQGGPAWDGYQAVCRYLDPETGRRCAVGQLLSENSRLNTSRSTFSLDFYDIMYGEGLIPDYDSPIKVIDAIYVAQLIHDDAGGTYNLWNGIMQSAAKGHLNAENPLTAAIARGAIKALSSSSS